MNAVLNPSRFPEGWLTLSNRCPRSPKCEGRSITILKHYPNRTMPFETFKDVGEVVCTRATIRRNFAIPHRNAFCRAIVERQENQTTASRLSGKLKRDRGREFTAAIACNINLISGTSGDDRLADPLPESRRPFVVTTKRRQASGSKGNKNSYNNCGYRFLLHVSAPSANHTLQNLYHRRLKLKQYSYGVIKKNLAIHTSGVQS